MNERMIELHKQAVEFAYKTCKEEGRAKWETDYIRNTLTTSKFAELIVQECIDVVDVGGEFVSRPKMVERLKEHFGVAE